MDSIRERYEGVLEKITRTAQSVGRDPNHIRVVVVTKHQPVEIVQEAISAGALYLGENYADEAVEKMIALQLQMPGFNQLMVTSNGIVGENNCQMGIQWHIIGHVQSRKARLVCENFDYLHSLDSQKLAQRINNSCAELRRVLPVLLEFNMSGEQSKSGWPAWDETHWEDLLMDIEPIVELPYVQVKGLMTMPPFFDNPEDARPYFLRLRKLQNYLDRRIPKGDWRELSMGMSGDYHVAVQEGATWVRIGQAILGPRHP